VKQKVVLGTELRRRSTTDFGQFLVSSRYRQHEQSQRLGIYEGLIKPVVEEEGFRSIKSDDIFSTTAVVEDIWENINRAALVIAEISTNNPNVMYELGICHTVGKNVMMITQDTSSIPFNFRHLRCYGYEDDIRGANELKDNLRSVLRQIRATSDPATS
jgi:hypothetical protein